MRARCYTGGLGGGGRRRAEAAFLAPPPPAGRDGPGTTRGIPGVGERLGGPLLPGRRVRQLRGVHSVGDGSNHYFRAPKCRAP